MAELAEPTPSPEPAATEPEVTTEQDVSSEPDVSPEADEQPIPVPAEPATPAEPLQPAEPSEISAPESAIPDAGQQTLELGAVGSPYAPEAAAAAAATAAAAAAAVSGATPVHTYGEPDLDEMVDKLAATPPDAAASAEQTAAHVPGEAPAASVLAVKQPNMFVITPTWPFLVYFLGWVAFSVALVLTTRGAASKGDLFLSPYYYIFVAGGLALLALVVPLVFGIWLWARSRHLKGDRGGLFVSAFLKGALVLFLGVATWWGAYYAAVALS